MAGMRRGVCRGRRARRPGPREGSEEVGALDVAEELFEVEHSIKVGGVGVVVHPPGGDAGEGGSGELCGGQVACRREEVAGYGVVLGAVFVIALAPRRARGCQRAGVGAFFDWTARRCAA